MNLDLYPSLQVKQVKNLWPGTASNLPETQSGRLHWEMESWLKVQRGQPDHSTAPIVAGDPHAPHPHN